MSEDEFLSSFTGGSLLNDLLSDLEVTLLNAPTTSTNDNSKKDYDYNEDVEDAQHAQEMEDLTNQLLQSLERDLLYDSNDIINNSSYQQTNLHPPPGISTLSAGAIVVQQQQLLQQHQANNISASSSTEDAWSMALSQLEGRSLAADFLAADSAKKQKGEVGLLPPPSMLEDYTLEEQVLIKSNTATSDGETVDAVGGLMALLGASKAKTSASKTPSKEVAPKNNHGNEDNHDEFRKRMGPALKATLPSSDRMLLSPQNTAGTKAPPPSPMFPPLLHRTLPPGVGEIHTAPLIMPPPHPVISMSSPHLMPPPHDHHLMMPPMIPNFPVPPPTMEMGTRQPPIVAGPLGLSPLSPLPYSIGGLPTTASRTSSRISPHQPLFDQRDFPTMGSAISNKVSCRKDGPHPPTILTPNKHSSSSSVAAVRAQILFNNPDPMAPLIQARIVQTASMPSRDLCYVINSMLRPLLSVDPYNDDYYHWSFVARKSTHTNVILIGREGPYNAAPIFPPKLLPNPVWKEVKLIGSERESKFRQAADMRSKEFAEEKKSLGRLDKSNVKRPRALLSTPIKSRDQSALDDLGCNEEEKECDATTLVDEKKIDSNYEIEQHRNRVQVWKARVAIDKGYTAFLSLMELRRLIQANANAPHLILKLVSDVKSYVELMHASLGVAVTGDSESCRTVKVDRMKLASTISMSKGCTLCARAIESGILPHQSACEILPVALYCIFSMPLPTKEGEDRLLRALTSLVLTHRPSVNPEILCRSLNMALLVAKVKVEEEDSKINITNIIGNLTRMELLHSILSRGKDVCSVDEKFGAEWAQKESDFMDLLKMYQPS